MDVGEFFGDGSAHMHIHIYIYKYIFTVHINKIYSILYINAVQTYIICTYL